MGSDQLPISFPYSSPPSHPILTNSHQADVPLSRLTKMIAVARAIPKRPISMLRGTAESRTTTQKRLATRNEWLQCYTISPANLQMLS